ncbi:MAG: dTMP kinase [Candidatus Paceibacterota bacterium]|jgi:dTMP kinase
MSARKGKFIVFEGLDGSGKSAQIELFIKYLTEHRHDVLQTEEPTSRGESPFSDEIDDVLKHKKSLTPKELQELFVKDRKWHVEQVIIPALDAGKTVVSDRYLFSTVAFGSLNLDVEWLKQINEPFPIPDLTFIFIARPEVCLQRITKNGRELELFEKTEKLRKAGEIYAKMPEWYPNVYLIDGERSVEEIHKEVINLSK